MKLQRLQLVALPLFVALAGAAAWPAHAGTAGAALRPRASYAVHEWGTFTSVAGDDGRALVWRPLTDRSSDLPSFVYSNYKEPSAPPTKGRIPGTVRMETPVLYFYSDAERDVRVRVGFDAGLITEWYPKAVSVGDHIDWGTVKVMPGSHAAFPTDGTASHYYPARDTDAAPVRVSVGANVEDEKFLFYRGVARMELPVVAALDGDTVKLRDDWDAGVGTAIVFERRGDRLGWTSVKLGTADAVVRRPALDGRLEDLLATLHAELVAQGLYAKEASAMIATWRDHWFEEGLRVLHVLPRAITDSTIPLTLDPAPAELVRVMVNRIEVITPDMERVAGELVKATGTATAASRKATVAALEKRYGRFARVILERTAAHSKSDAERAAITKILAG
ncbi:MAG TPA: hypothetical protein VG389_23885 [Myxococcota bacterium]|jgi:hypothetical protein|nr:hypothetical protein [Myxococcota bacterium]